LVTTIDLALGQSFELKDADHYRAIKLPELQNETEGGWAD
jgi:hypothetical protein